MNGLRFDDACRVHRLVDECRERGDDAAVWMSHLAQGTLDLVEADAVGTGQVSGFREKPTRSLGIVDTGWDRGVDRAGWMNALAQWAADPFYSPFVNEAYRRLEQSRDPIVVVPEMALNERAWRRSHAYRSTVEAMNCRETAICMFDIPTGPDDGQMAVFHRIKDRKFSARDRHVLLYLSRQIGPLVGGPLAGMREKRPSDLSPRLRQTLACVLEGDTDKQIAARLAISGHTAKQYVRMLLDYFQTKTRTELMARWIKRGWGARFAWRETTPPVMERLGM